MGFSRQEYWSDVPCPFPGNLPDPGIELASLMPPALAGGFFTTRAPWEATLNVQSDTIISIDFPQLYTFYLVYVDYKNCDLVATFPLFFLFPPKPGTLLFTALILYLSI